MQIRGLLIFLFIVYANVAVAQFTVDGYLSNAISSEEVQYFRERQDFVSADGFKSPILREVEFRARVRNFGEGFSDYRLRFSPLNPFEKKANNDFQEALSRQLQAEYQLNLEKVLESRYQLMIEHHKLTKSLMQLNETEVFYQKAIQTLQNSSSNNSIKDFIALDKAHMGVTMDIEEAKHGLQSIERTIRYTYAYSGKLDWQAVELVDVETIRNWYNSASPNLKNNLFLKNEQGKEAVASAEYNVERKESFRNLGYVQAEYRQDADNSFGQNMGMQVAVNLPIVNPDKPDLQRRKLDLLEDAQDLQEEQRELEQYMTLLFSDLALQINQFDMISEKFKRYEGQNFTTSNSGDALDLLIELNEFKSELSIMIIDIIADIQTSYIALLSIEGKLSQQPYIIYILKDQRSFEMEE